MVTPAAWRAAVTELARGARDQRAADLFDHRCRSERDALPSLASDYAATWTRLKELAAERRRFGWRRLKLLPEREGIRWSHKKLRRLYTEERLQVRRRDGRKRALDTRAPMALPQGPNQRWSLDFASDTLTDGRRFRTWWSTTSPANASAWLPTHRFGRTSGPRADRDHCAPWCPTASATTAPS